MASLKSRIDKLHSASIDMITSRFVIYKNDQVIKTKTIGNNTEKEIVIVIRLTGSP